MYFALENVKNHAFSPKLFGQKLGFQVSPETICRSACTMLYMGGQRGVFSKVVRGF